MICKIEYRFYPTIDTTYTQKYFAKFYVFKLLAPGIFFTSEELKVIILANNKTYIEDNHFPIIS